MACVLLLSGEARAQPVPAAAAAASSPKSVRLSAASATGSGVTLSYLDGLRPAAPDNLVALGPQMFGDSVNLFNGALQFEHTDLQIPGNSSLPVQVVRRYVPGRTPQVRGLYGDWDLLTPRVSGSFLPGGWLSSNGGANRCSGYSAPPTRVVSGSGGAVSFVAKDYWHGTMLEVPGHAPQELLLRAAAYSAQPTTGGPYPIVTKEHWQLRCLPTVLNATGEGFEAVSPDGVRYVFNWMATRFAGNVKKAGASDARVDHYLMATEVIDRFGNWVLYAYDPANPLRLLSVTANDDRVLNLAYAGNLLSSAADGLRTVGYAYDASQNLNQVTLADGSRWAFNLGGLLHPNYEELGEGAKCDSPGVFTSTQLVGTMTHPSGAVGTFTTQFVSHGRTYVDRYCWYIQGTSGQTTGNVYPHFTKSQSLIQKAISGPGLPAMAWQYTYGLAYGWSPCVGCADRKVNTLTAPDGVVTRYTYGVRWRVNEGQLLATEEGWNGSAAARSTIHRYRQHSSAELYPERFGTSPNFLADWLFAANRPLDKKAITQQGVAFTWETDVPAIGFDKWARVLKQSKGSGLGYSKSESLTYHDNTDKWVLGQPASLTELTTGLVVEAHDYDPVTAVPKAKHSFGKKIESYDYNPSDGTLSVVYDAAGKATTLYDFKRGQPQRVVYADGSSESQVINDQGWASSRTTTSHPDEAGFTTRYDFDAMGRVTAIYPPSEYTTTLEFTQVGYAEFGLAPGHWRQTVTKGNSTTKRWFDAMWRPRLQVRYDASNPGSTSSYVETRFDAAGRQVFQSYPTRTFTQLDAGGYGRQTEYDGLNRPVAVRANSELGLLSTTTHYLNNFRRLVINPRGYEHTYAYQAFDTPSEDRFVAQWSPEGVSVGVQRDVFGKALSITRTGTYQGNYQTLTRHYAYDIHQRLCKTVEPEEGATVVDYDMAGNIEWRGSGLALPITSSCATDRDSVPPSRKTSYAYDQRNRLRTTSFGDGSPGITRTYTADSLLQQVSSYHKTWTYGYSPERRLVSELYTWWAGAQPGQGWNFTWGLDGHGSVSSLTDPWGLMTYAPNALGQATQVSGYASGVIYHPNGAVAGYLLNNGVSYSMTPNLRGLPEVSRDMGVVWDQTAYDANGNVASITDLQEGITNRNMGYDGLDRLKVANGSWGAGLFDYDAQDNLRASIVGGRTLSHNFIDGTNRLNNLSGSQNIAILYDANGNVTQRGGQEFVFDLGNRLSRAQSKADYLYDGHGRRALVYPTDGSYRLYAYSQQGKLLFSHRSNAEGTTRYVYLGAKLIAESTPAATTYSHTDALGSSVAKTNSVGGLISRTRYEPYGATASGTNPTNIGFTGHVNDPDTGLVYMQQRYYDPVAGRFLSVDPVVTDTKTGDSFNRYVYANNNPYKFVDPDGRFAFVFAKPGAIFAVGMVGALAQGGLTALNGGSAKEVGLAAFGGFLSGATTAAGVLAGATTKGAGLMMSIESGASTGTTIAAGAAGQILGQGVAAGVNAIDVGQTIGQTPPATGAAKSGATSQPADSGKGSTGVQGTASPQASDTAIKKPLQPE